MNYGGRSRIAPFLANVDFLALVLFTSASRLFQFLFVVMLVSCILNKVD